MAALESITGIVVIAIVGAFLDGTPRPMTCGIAACALAALALTHWPLKPAPRIAEPAV
jgi:hypothetical protein